MVISGESLLNDGTAIVVFNLFKTLTICGQSTATYASKHLKVNTCNGGSLWIAYGAIGVDDADGAVGAGGAGGAPTAPSAPPCSAAWTV